MKDVYKRQPQYIFDLSIYYYVVLARIVKKSDMAQFMVNKNTEVKI